MMLEHIRAEKELTEEGGAPGGRKGMEKTLGILVRPRSGIGPGRQGWDAQAGVQATVQLPFFTLRTLRVNPRCILGRCFELPRGDGAFGGAGCPRLP